MGKLPCEAHKLLAVGNFIIGALFMVLNVIGLLGNFVTFQFTAFIVSLYLVFAGCVLTMSSLFTHRYVAAYCGFFQYPLGTGLMLLLIGFLNLGSGGLGVLMGVLALIWGVISILFHFWFRRQTAANAVHVPLLRRM